MALWLSPLRPLALATSSKISRWSVPVPCPQSGVALTQHRWSGEAGRAHGIHGTRWLARWRRPPQRQQRRPLTDLVSSSPGGSSGGLREQRQLASGPSGAPAMYPRLGSTAAAVTDTKLATTPCCLVAADPKDKCFLHFWSKQAAVLLFSLLSDVFVLAGEVFLVSSPEKFTWEEARAECQSLRAELATTGQLYAAWSDGLDHCNPGWLADGSVRYPIVTPREKCGGNLSGVKTIFLFRNQTGFPDPQSKYDVYCFRGKDPLAGAVELCLQLPPSFPGLPLSLAMLSHPLSPGQDRLFLPPSSVHQALAAGAEPKRDVATPEQQNAGKKDVGLLQSPHHGKPLAWFVEEQQGRTGAPSQSSCELRRDRCRRRSTQRGRALPSSGTSFSGTGTSSVIL
ncbi:Brevican core protein [Varanus komodoensis]|nr:Brevican core protein [Varanus komodoensis]